MDSEPTVNIPLPNSPNLHSNFRRSPEDEVLDPDLRYDGEPPRKISTASLPNSRIQQRPATNEAIIINDQTDTAGAETQPSEEDVVDSAAPTSSSKKPLVKRVRIPIACVTCRHKKIKCNGQVPCSHCEKYRAECIYPAATKPISHEYVEALESRLRNTESHLLKLLAHGIRLPGSVNVLDSANLHPLHGNIGAVAQTSNNDLFEGSSRGSQDPTPEEMNVTEQQPFVKDHANDLVDALMGRLKIDPNGSARHLSPLHSTHTGSHADSHRTGLTAQAHMPEAIGHLPKTTVPVAIPAIVPPKVSDTLFSSYFNNIHTFLPILSGFSLQGVGLEHPSQAMPPFLLMAIYTVASCYVGDRELEGLTIGRNSKPHQVFYDRTRAMLDASMSTPSLSTVQGLLLMTYYQLIELQPESLFRSRMYLQIAIRMAMDLGLSRVTSGNHPEKPCSHNTDLGLLTLGISLTPEATPSLLGGNTLTSKLSDATLETQRDRAIQQERQLAWLACYSLDGILSGLLGQEPCAPEIHDNAWQLFQEIKSTAATDTNMSSTLAFWYLHLELVRIYRRICELNKSLVTSGPQTIRLHQRTQALDRALDEWRARLPEHLIFVQDEYSAPGPRADDPNLPSYYAVYLHQYYYSLRVLLYRPLVYSKNHRGSLSDPRSALSNCVRAAARLTQLGQIIFHNYDWPWQGCGLFGYQMLLAAEIHLYLMVTQTCGRAQILFHTTMELTKGYMQLVNLSWLAQQIETMEKAVRNYATSPQLVNAHQESSSETESLGQQLSPSFMDMMSLSDLVNYNHHDLLTAPPVTIAAAATMVPENLGVTGTFDNLMFAIPTGDVNTSFQTGSTEGHPPPFSLSHGSFPFLVEQESIPKTIPLSIPSSTELATMSMPVSVPIQRMGGSEESNRAELVSMFLFDTPLSLGGNSSTNPGGAL